MSDTFTTVILALVAGTTLIQIAPIKLNPWSWLAKAIGRAINEEVIQRVDKIEQELKEQKAYTEEQAAKGCRIRILRFGDEILHGVHHSKEHFDQILLDITDYENYCKDHPAFKNNMTVLTTRRIMATYERCLEERSFPE